MADENTQVAEPTNKQQVIPTTEIRETVSLNEGVDQGSTVNKLRSIFDKVQDGSDVKTAIKEVNQKPSTKPEEKKEEMAQPPRQDEKPNDISPKLEEKKEEPKEVTRKSIRERFDAQTEPSKPVAEPKTQAGDDEEVKEEELQVLHYDKPKTAKRIQALLKRIETVTSSEATTKKELQVRDEKLATLQKDLEAAKSVDPKTNEEIKKQLDELSMFRRRYELDNDPDVKSKFDGRVESAEKSIIDILKKNGAGEPTIKLIESEGGWMRFASSDRVVTFADGTKLTAAELAEEIVKAVPFQAKKSIEAASLEIVTTKREKDRFFEDEQKKANEYFSKKEQESKQQTESQRKLAEENVKAIDEWKKGLLDKDEMFKQKDVPTTATKEERAAIEEQNKYTGQLRSLLEKTLSVSSREDMLDVVLDSVRYYDEKRKVGALTAQVKKLTEELKAKGAEVDKVRSASRSTPKGQSIAAGGSGGNQEPQKATSLSQAFDAIGRGQRLDGRGNILNSQED